MVWTTPLHAKTWATQFPYARGELSPVFHAKSQDEVLAKATKFCKENELCRAQYPDDKIRSTMALGVVGFNNLFVTTMCRQSSGEHIYVTVPSQYDDDMGRTDGKERGREIIKQAGLLSDDCYIHAVYGVKSRSRLKGGLEVEKQEPQVQNVSGEVRVYKIQRRNATRMARESLD